MNEEKPTDRRWFSKFTFLPADNGGRRSGIDRRHFEYFKHIPERRSGIDRRNRGDRRNVAQNTELEVS
jgi:hypothetical protein